MTISQKPMLAVFAVLFAISSGIALAQTTPSNTHSVAAGAAGKPVAVPSPVPDSYVPDSSAVGTRTNPQAVTPAAASTVTTTGGTASYIPKFSGASTIVNSEIYDNGTNVGIGIIPGSSKLDLNGAMTLRGPLTVFRSGTATSTAGYPSYPVDFFSSAYNSSTKAVVSPYFQLQSEPVSNDTSSPSAQLNLLYNGNGGTAAETGFYIKSNGIIHFASGQTFGGSSVCIATGGGFGSGGTTFVGPSFSLPTGGGCAPWAGFTKTASTVVLQTSGSACVSTNGLKLTLSLSSADPNYLGAGTQASDYIQLTRASASGTFTSGSDQGEFSGTAVQVTCTASLLTLAENND